MAVLDVGPSKLDLVGLVAGDVNSLVVTFKHDGAPLDTTGATVASQVREAPESDTIVLTATVAPVDEAGGVWGVSWDGGEIRTLLNGSRTYQGFWDLEITLAGASGPETVLSGLWEAVSDVTR